MALSAEALKANEDSPLASGLWLFINALQACFLGVWSALCITFAIARLVVTGDREGSIELGRTLWAPGLLKAAGARFDVRGFEGLDEKKPYVFAFSHESLLDTPVAFFAAPRNVRFIVKQEVAGYPFIGWYCRAMGYIFVDRKNHDQAVRSLERATALLKDGACVMVFPEGKRSQDGRVQPFKKGAFHVAVEAGVEIVPVAIVGARKVLPWGGFKVRPGLIRVFAGEPVDASRYSKETLDTLVAEVRNRVIDLHLEAGGKGGDRSLHTRTDRPDRRVA